MHRFKCWNGAMNTTAALTGVATGTAIKTMLQISTPSTRQIQLISWGFSMFDISATDSIVELIQTDVAATVTAHVASGLQPLDPNSPASLMTLGTANTGYTATAEGSTTATRLFDQYNIRSGTNMRGTLYEYQWMPDERPIVAVSKFLRVRATTPTTTTNMNCWVCWDE